MLYQVKEIIIFLSVVATNRGATAKFYHMKTLKLSFIFDLSSLGIVTSLPRHLQSRSLSRSSPSSGPDSCPG